MSHQLRLALETTGPALSTQQMEELVLDLKTEIEHASRFSIPVNETKQKNEGTLGPEWLPILSVLLATPVAVELAKGLVVIVQDWLRRNRHVVVVMKTSKGNHRIDSVGLSGEEVQKIASHLI